VSVYACVALFQDPSLPPSLPPSLTCGVYSLLPRKTYERAQSVM